MSGVPIISILGILVIIGAIAALIFFWKSDRE